MVLVYRNGERKGIVSREGGLNTYRGEKFPKRMFQNPIFLLQTTAFLRTGPIPSRILGSSLELLLSLLNDSLGLRAVFAKVQRRRGRKGSWNFGLLIVAPDWFWELKAPSAKRVFRESVGRGKGGVSG